MVASVANVQLGKNGITEGFIQTIKSHFKYHKNVKIAVLKSCCRERIYLKEIAEKIIERLGENYNYRVVGYTINIKKLRKDKTL